MDTEGDIHDLAFSRNHCVSFKLSECAKMLIFHLPIHTGKRDIYISKLLMNDDCNFILRQQSPLKSHHVGPLIHYNYTDSRVLGILQPTYLEDIFRSTGISFKIKPDTRTNKSHQQYTLFKFYSVYFYGFI